MPRPQITEQMAVQQRRVTRDAHRSARAHLLVAEARAYRATLHRDALAAAGTGGYMAIIAADAVCAATVAVDRAKRTVNATAPTPF